MISLLAKNFSLKVIKSVLLSIDTYEQDLIAVGYQKKKIKTITNGIISIICPCNHSWGIIIVHPYYIWLKVLFVLLTIFQLDI